MTTETFRKLDFERALTDALQGADLKWIDDGLISGERHYSILITRWVKIQVNSTVMKDGLAAPTGENSIRAWITDHNGNPLGSKIQRWVTRVPGWQKRLETVLEKLVNMADAIHYCSKCKSIEKVFIVKKDGPNKGRLFLKCNCEGSFSWLGDERDEDTPAPKAEMTPPCPKCMGPTTKRSGRNGAFWACLDRACYGSMDYFEFTGQDLTKVGAWVRSRKSYGKPVGYKPSLYTQPTIDLEYKAKFAEREAEQERAAFASDPDMVRLAAQPAAEIAKTAPTPTVIKLKKFTPNRFQSVIFDQIRKVAYDAARNALTAMVIEALAGTGKSTTLAELCKLLPREKDIVLVAFNVQAKDDLKKKVPSWVKVCTYNSLGNSACMDGIGRNKTNVDDEGVKMRAILESTLSKQVYGHLYSTVRELVDLVKCNLLEGTDDELDEMVLYHGLDLLSSRDVIYKAVRVIIQRCREMTDLVDFGDQCWLPIVLNLPCHKYDIVMIDEAQDTNRAQIALVLKSIKPDGIIIAVGDRYQSIYGFRGADAEAIPNLIDSLKAETLPLSQTFRNPKLVVDLVRQKFPYIPLEAKPDAEDGIIRTLTEDKALAEYQPGDMVLCRCNAPLVKPAFALIRHGIKATIRGRQISKGLTKLVARMSADNVEDLIIKLTEYRNMEVAKLLNAEKGAAAQNLQDSCDTIIALSDGLTDIFALNQRISTIFSDGTDGVVFSSVHRAKGLEADRVFILNPELMPHPMAKQPWERQQEANIEYVAITRTRRELIYVTTD